MTAHLHPPSTGGAGEKTTVTGRLSSTPESTTPGGTAGALPALLPPPPLQLPAGQPYGRASCPGFTVSQFINSHWPDVLFLLGFGKEFFQGGAPLPC